MKCAYFARKRREEREVFWSAFGFGALAVFAPLVITLLLYGLVHR